MNCQEKLNISQHETQDISPGLTNQDGIERLSLGLLPMINGDRFRNRSEWLDIGRALYSECDGSKEGLKVWIKASRNAFINGGVPKFIDDIDVTCKQLYYTYYTGCITVKTLAWYARKDPPNDYVIWHNARCQKSIQKAFSGTITDAAAALYNMLWLDYCYSPQKHIWYIYQQNRWVQLSNIYKLRKFVSTTLTEAFFTSRNELGKNPFVNEQYIKAVSRVIMKLLTISFRSNVVREAQAYFSVNHVSSFLDANDKLTGTNNGVLEVVDGKVLFRDGKPEDYISLTTHIDYNPLLTVEDPLVQKCNSWFHEAFDDISRYRFINLVANSLFRGRSSDLSLNGNGSNSISCLQQLCRETFGDYCQLRFRNTRQPRSRLNIFPEEEHDKNARDTIRCVGTWVSDTAQLDKHSRCYLADPFFYDKVPALAPAFLWILSHEYPNLQ